MTKTHKEWVAYFYSIGIGHGDLWHLMRGLHSLGLVTQEAGEKIRRVEVKAAEAR